MRRGKIFLVGIELVGRFVLLDQRQLRLAAETQILHVLDQRFALHLRQQFERRHRRARHAFRQSAHQVRLGRRLIRRRALELVPPLAVIARVRLQEFRRGAQRVAGDAVAMHAVQPEQSLAVTVHRPGGHFDLSQVQPGFGQHERIVGRAVHRLQNVGDLLLMLRRDVGRGHLHQIGMEPRGGSIAASQRRDQRRQQAQDTTIVRSFASWIVVSTAPSTRRREF